MNPTRRIAIFASVLLLSFAAAVAQQPNRTPEDGAVFDLSAPVEVFEDGTVVSRSRQAVMAVTGSFDYTLPDGKVQTVTWVQNFGGAFMLRPGFQHGSTYRFPATRQQPGSDAMIEYQNVTLTGAVLRDGSVWGEDGASLKAKCADRARAGRFAVRELLELQRQQPPGWLRDILSSKQPLREGPLEKSVHLALRGLLYDKATNSLKGDPETVLQDLLDFLGQF